jgi:hypothetical protein
VKRLLLLLTILVMSGLMWPEISRAQSCGCGYYLDREVDAAQVIVVGRVVEYMGEGEPAGSQSTSVSATVTVERYMKGSGPAEVRVNGSGGPCALFGELAIGQRFLFLFREPAEPFEARSCSGSGRLTTEYEDASIAQIEALLTADALPSGGGPPEPGHGTVSLVPSALVVLGPLVFLAGAAFVWRRGERHNG